MPQFGFLQQFATHSLLIVSDLLCVFPLNIMKNLKINRFVNKSKYHNADLSKKVVERIKECGTAPLVEYLKLTYFYLSTFCCD